MKILLTYLVIVAMIVLHELGHFIAGKMFKVNIEEFSIGFGPALWQKKKEGHTTISVRAIPLGGYCAFDADDKTGAIDHALDSLPAWQQVIISVAGPAMNILFCLALTFIIGIGPGLPSGTTTIDSVQPGYSAAEYLKPGDVIISIDDVSIETTDELSAKLAKLDDSEISIGVIRDGEKYEYSIKPKAIQGGLAYSAGILCRQEYHRLSLVESIVFSVSATWFLITTVVGTFAKLFTGAIAVEQMSSIVGATDAIAVYASISQISTYLFFCAYVSVNLGILNMVPIPGLDGFRALKVTLESCFKRKMTAKLEENLVYICMMFLFFFAGLLILKDVLLMFVNV